jgi:hypothetical protein
MSFIHCGAKVRRLRNDMQTLFIIYKIYIGGNTVENLYGTLEGVKGI